jgi:hypothetical protein
VVSIRTLPPATLQLDLEFRRQILPKGPRTKKYPRRRAACADNSGRLCSEEKTTPAHETSDSHVNNKNTAPHDFNHESSKSCHPSKMPFESKIQSN